MLKNVCTSCNELKIGDRATNCGSPTHADEGTLLSGLGHWPIKARHTLTGPDVVVLTDDYPRYGTRNKENVSTGQAASTELCDP